MVSSVEIRCCLLALILCAVGPAHFALGDATSIRGMTFLVTKNAKPVGGNLLHGVVILSRRWFCLSQCDANPSCGSVVWKGSSGECGLIAEYQSELLFIGEQGIMVYSKKPCRTLEYYDRVSWNAAPPIDSIDPLAVPVSYVVIHHTAISRGDNWPGDCGDLSDCFLAMRGIQFYDMHSRSKPWADIAVNFFLDATGRLYEGRGWTQNPAYLTNTTTGGAQGYGMHLAVTFFGDFRYAAPTNASRVSIRAFCACAIEKGYLTRSYTVLGHVEDRYFKSYKCPGQAMLDMLHNWPLL